jgi:hypothetical protein
MGVRQILRAQEIIAVVPDARKAKAVAACCEGEISPLAPASILHASNTTIYLDKALRSAVSATVCRWSSVLSNAARDLHPANHSTIGRRVPHQQQDQYRSTAGPARQR